MFIFLSLYTKFFSFDSILYCLNIQPDLTPRSQEQQVESDPVPVMPDEPVEDVEHLKVRVNMVE